MRGGRSRRDRTPIQNELSDPDSSHGTNIISDFIESVCASTTIVTSSTSSSHGMTSTISHFDESANLKAPPSLQSYPTFVSGFGSQIRVLENNTNEEKHDLVDM